MRSNPFDRAESGQPQRISLAEHDRTMGELAREISQLRRDRVHAADVLRAFREAPLSISSVQPVLGLAAELCGPIAKHFEEPKVLAFPYKETRLCTYCGIRPAEDQSDFCGADCRIDAEQE